VLLLLDSGPSLERAASTSTDLERAAGVSTSRFGLAGIRYGWVALRLHLLILHALRLHALRLHALAAALLGALAANRQKAEHGDEQDREPKERVISKAEKIGKTHFMVTTRSNRGRGNATHNLVQTLGRRK